MKPEQWDSSARTPSQDAEIARLTARADKIVAELDAIVAQMSDALRTAYGTGT